MKVMSYNTDGTSKTEDVTSFKDLQTLVGGYVEIITLRLSDNHPIPCAVNEEGQLLNLPANPHVTIEYDDSPLPPNTIVLGERLPYICGNIIALPADWEAQLEAHR